MWRSNVLIIAVIAAVIVLFTAAYLYPVSRQVGEVTELTLMRTGGFIGLDEKLVIRANGSTKYTSNQFGDAILLLDETEVADLLEKTDFFTADRVYTAKSGVADYYIYRLTVQTGFDVKTIEWVDGWASEETLPSELGEMQLHLQSIIERVRKQTGVSGDALERAVRIAKDFIVQAPTFKFDGIPETLRVLDALTLESFPEQHIVTITFDSRHAGYGDREGQVLAQVITSHTAKVTVVNDNVVSAILDEEWDELKQEPLPQAAIMEPEEVRDLAMSYIKERHPDAARYIDAIVWKGGRATPPGLVGHETYLYNDGNWTVTIEWNVVAPEHLAYEVVAEHISGIVWNGEVREGKVTESSYKTQEIEKPEGALTVSELLEDPVYDTEVTIYGKVGLLGELFCPCFSLTSSGESIEVWYGLMVEDDGTERPSVSVEGIKNGDWAIVTGELKTEGEHRSLNDFWASNIARMCEVEVHVYEVEVGQRFAITLKSNPTTGYQWQLAKPLDEDIVKLIGSEYKTLATKFPPPPGTGGIEVWTFEGVSPGTAEISLKYVRPWEEDVPPERERTFVITVE